MAETLTPPAPNATPSNVVQPMPNFLADLSSNIAQGVAETVKENKIQAQANEAKINPAITPPAPEPKKESPTPSTEAKNAPETKPDPKESKSAVDLEALANAETLPRTSADWNARKAAQKELLAKAQKERDDLKAKYEATTKEYETLKSKPLPPEFEAVAKERDALSERLKLVAVTEHPEFKQYFDGRVAQQQAIATSQLGEETAKKLITLAQMAPSEYRDGKMEELLADVPTFKQAQVGAILNELAQIDQHKQTVIANAKTKYDQIIAAEKTASEQSQSARRAEGEKIFNSILAKQTDAEAGSPFFKPKQGDDAWNAEVQSRLDYAKKLVFDQVKPEDGMQAAFNAAAYPSVAKHAAALAEEVTSLKEQIAKLTAATPKLETERKQPSAQPGSATRFNPNSTGWTPQSELDAMTKGLIESARE